MIITRLFGGAGNQLFQYAAGRMLADHLGTDLALDRRYMRIWDETRADCFSNYKHTRFVEKTGLPPSKFEGPLRYNAWRLFGRTPRFRRENGLGYNADFFDLPDDSYLHGYWQSERYFHHAADRIRAELRLTEPLDEANQAMVARIQASGCAVSVHVRRGDYLGDGGFAACPPEYYAAAVARLSEEVAQPLTCFVFSNDPGWARDHLSLGAETVVVDINDETQGHFDMHLQSLCAHNIIANSTFSWWGAWLNKTSDKQVIAPKTWFAPGKPANPDICPDSWIRL
ncbi:MAG: alpha-1,2-fucosyltransferase [Pseudomonadota bacterium]